MDPYYQSPLASLYGTGREPSAIQPLAPYDEQNILKKLGQKVLPGVVWAGQVLDKSMGARGLRGLVSGNPRELASVLPFSDTLGITDPHDIVHGQDLLRNAGLISGENDDWQNVLAGIGTEIALNPATYLTLGSSATTNAGQLAGKLGVLPKTALGRIQGLSALSPEATAAAGRLGINTADVLNQPLGGLAGLGIPFRAPSAVLGTGPTAQAIAGKMGQAADWLKYSMAGRAGSALFDSTVKGLTTGPFQRGLRDRVGTLAETLAAGRGQIGGMVQDLNAAGGVTNPIGFRGVLEGIGQGTPAEQAAYAQSQGLLASHLGEEGRAMLPAKALQDRWGVEYFPRNPLELEREGAASGPRVLQTRIGAMEGRDPILKDVPRGTQALEDIRADPAVSGPGRTLNPLQARAHIFQHHLSGPTVTADLGRLTTLRQIAGQRALLPHEAAELGDLEFLWNKAAELEPWAARAAGPVYRDPMVDLLGRTEGSINAVANANTIRSVFTSEAVPMGSATGRVMPLPAAIKAAGFADEPATYHAFVQDLIASGKLPPTATIGDLGGIMVPEAIASDATRLGGMFQGLSDSVSTPLRAIDSATSLFRGFSTSLFPSFFAKKAASGIFRGLAAGSGPGDVAFATEAMNLLRSGQTIPGLASKVPYFAGMTDAEATAALGRLGFAHQAFGLSQEGLPELASTSTTANISEQIPGEIARPGPGDILKNIFRGRTDAAGQSIDTLGQRFNPLNIRGVGGVGGMDLRNVDQFAPMVAGRQAASAVDDWTRGSTFLERLMKGYSPGAAADFTKATHFVGSDLAPFEQSFMRRLIPFYSYLRHKVPWVAENLMEQPGGLQAMAIRAAGDVGEQQRQNVPPGLGGGLAIPIPGAPEGRQAYLTRLGLPFDEALGFIGTGPDAIEHTGMKLAGQFNPLLKAPLELATGREFMTDSGANDQYGRADVNLPNRILMNSPLARLAGAIQTLERTAEGSKAPAAAAINLLTGAKTSEVDVAKERLGTERDLVQRLLQGDPNIRRFEQYYVHPDEVPHLSQQEMELLRLQKTMEARAQAAARARK